MNSLTANLLEIRLNLMHAYDNFIKITHLGIKLNLEIKPKAQALVRCSVI